MTPAERMIEAIRVINAATFHAGVAPHPDAPDDLPEMHEMARRAGSLGIALRYFQRAGIASRDVAKAVELGVLRVQFPDSE